MRLTQESGLRKDSLSSLVGAVIITRHGLVIRALVDMMLFRTQSRFWDCFCSRVISPLGRHPRP